MRETLEERLREALAASRGGRPPRADCANTGTLWAVSRGEADPDEARRIVDHSLDCEACAEALQLAREIDARVTTASRDRRALARPGAGFRWLAAAAMLAAIGVVWWQLGPDDVPESELRQPGAVTIESSVPTGATLPRDAFVLRWIEIDPGALHSLKIATRELRVLHRAQGIEGAEYTVPAEALADLASGTTILWSVEAVKPDATRVNSETFRVVLE